MGSLYGSVVANIKTAYEGGSSNVFRKALNAAPVIICASSMMNTLYFPLTGVYLTSSIIRLMSSTPLLDAASTSTTSTKLPALTDRQFSHSLHGSPLIGCRQFTALANILAADVLPVPLVPVNRYACPILLFIS